MIWEFGTGKRNPESNDVAALEAVQLYSAKYLWGCGSPEGTRRVREAVMGHSVHTQRRFEQEVYVQVYKAWKGVAAAALAALLAGGMLSTANAQAKERKYKD